MSQSDGERMSSHYRSRSVFVTGATGLVGGHVIRQLLDAGADVTALVRDTVPVALDPAVRVVRGCITDQPVIERALGEYEVSTVIHLAAQTIVGIATRNPVSTFEANIRGTYTLLESCRRSPLVRSVVVASSDKAYGAAPTMPYDESTPLRGSSPYDVSKSCADLLSAAYARSYGLPVAVTRCGNFFGPGDLNWNRIVPGTVRSVLQGERPVIRSDGTLVRDYFYVEDGAAAYLLLAQALAERPELSGEAFNFSLEQPVDVRGMVGAVLRELGSDLWPEVRGEAASANEIQVQHLSAEKARRVLGWAPQFTLGEGLQRTVAWYRALLQGSPRCACAPEPGEPERPHEYRLSPGEATQLMMHCPSYPTRAA